MLCESLQKLITEKEKAMYKYLESMLDKENFSKLKTAVKHNTLIIVSGANGSGKTSLTRALRRTGQPVREEHEVCIIELKNKIENQDAKASEIIFSELNNILKH